MKAHYDGDVYVYMAGFAAEKQSNPQMSHAKRCLTMLVNSHKEFIEQRFKVKESIFYLTADDRSNFRYEVAKTQPYKGNRKASGKPFFYEELRDELQLKYSAEMTFGQEADDLMAIRACDNPKKNIIISKDKDLRMVPGWHWEMNVNHLPFYADDPGFLMVQRQSAGKAKVFGVGTKWFYFQCLVGDRVDNIPGIKGMGDMKAYEALKECTSAIDMYSKVLDIYQEHGHTKDRLIEVGQLLWMRRNREEMWDPKLTFTGI